MHHIESLHFVTFTSLQDIDVLLDESKDAFVPGLSNPDETPRDILTYFEDDPAFVVLGFKAEDTPLTYISGLPYQKDQSLIAIGPMYVSLEQRGRGLGKQQVKRFIDYAVESGYRGVFTKTWATNKASRSIFESCGFTLSGVKNNVRIGSEATISYELIFE